MKVLYQYILIGLLVWQFPSLSMMSGERALSALIIKQGDGLRHTVYMLSEKGSGHVEHEILIARNSGLFERCVRLFLDGCCCVEEPNEDEVSQLLFSFKKDGSSRFSG